MLKLQFLLQKWIQHPRLPLGHPIYAISITQNYHLDNFRGILAKTLIGFWVQMVESLAYTQDRYPSPSHFHSFNALFSFFLYGAHHSSFGILIFYLFIQDQEPIHI